MSEERKWECGGVHGSIQTWIRRNPKNDPQLRQRQFRFGPEAKTRITILIRDEKDIVEDEYEGGYTVWHGSLHAISYFVGLSKEDFSRLKSRRVLDIGCGSGMLGIFALKFLHAFEVFFQDLNEEVIEACTKENLMLNDLDLSHQIKLLHGPWQTCFQMIPKNIFNLILTSDTVYRLKNFEVLHECFDYLLDNEPDSRIYVGGKQHYFGNNGGILGFMEFVNQKQMFKARIVDTDDMSVPHSLLLLTRVV